MGGWVVVIENEPGGRGGVFCGMNDIRSFLFFWGVGVFLVLSGSGAL